MNIKWGNITVKDIIQYVLVIIFMCWVGILKNEQLKTKDETIKQLESINAFEKDRADILKANIDRMKTYADKMKDDKNKLEAKQYGPNNTSVKEISVDLDNNYKGLDNEYYKSMPASYKIKPKQ